jgi:hypothetical protein
MISDLLTCPYCNAEAPAGARGTIACPLCGETFTLPDGPAGAAPPSSFTAPTPQAPPAIAAYPPDRRRANRIVAGIVIGVMFVMAATGLTYALMTVQVRREHDRSLPRQSRKIFERLRKSGDPTEPTEAVAPSRLAALGYLPADTGVVAAVQVEELLASPAGKELRSQGVKLGGFELKLDDVKKWLGLGAEEIDHVVLGVQLRDGEDVDLTPPTHVVIRTRAAYDAAKVRAALQAGRPLEAPTPEGGTRPLYNVKVRNVPLRLWLADERTLVLGLFGKMQDVPSKPHEGASHLPSELRQVLEQRIAPGAPLWLAGHCEKWDRTVLPVLLEEVKGPPVLARLKEVRSFAVWVQPEKPVKVHGAFRCASEAAARRIEQQDLAPRRQANPDTFAFSRNGAWLDVQMKGNLEAPLGGGK